MSNYEFNDIEQNINQIEPEMNEPINEEQSEKMFTEEEYVGISEETNVEVNQPKEESNPEEVEEKDSVEEIKTQNKKRNVVYVSFPQNTTKISHKVMATGSKNEILATNRQLKLIPGRLYEVPVNQKTLNSDDFENIKVFSDIADQIDIRYVKDGYACVYSLVNRVVLKDKQRLCVLIGE